MKKFACGFTSIVLVSACLAQGQPAMTAPAAAAATPSATRPNTAIIPNLAQGFMAKHNANVEVAKKGDIDVLFMGDSITDFWRNAPGAMGGRRGGAAATNAAAADPDAPAPYAGKAVFDKYFGSMKVANFGIAGDTTQGVLWRLENGEGQGFKPKAIMLMIGTNNTGGRGGGNTSEEIALGVADVVFELRKDFPEAKILLLGVFPRNSGGAAISAKIVAINKIISGLDDGQHVFYKDIGSIFLASDGTTIPKDIMSDGLHPTSKGYALWAEAVKDTLAGFLQ